MTFDFLIVGGGIFGLSTAIELRKRKYSVSLINPDSLPHVNAASTDISKAVRMEYGSDELYFKMAEESISGWREWNDFFENTLFHEVGFLMLIKGEMEDMTNKFEKDSYDMLLANGYRPEKLSQNDIRKRFPSFNAEVYNESIYNSVGGYTESGKTIEVLFEYAKKLGVHFHFQNVVKIDIKNSKVKGVFYQNGGHLGCDNVIVCAGAHTHYLVPDLLDRFSATGHPVFHLKPKDSTFFNSKYLPVFMADVSNSGWYGFPFHPKEQVVKVAIHANGEKLDPNRSERKVSDYEIERLNIFISESMPVLKESKLVYTRKCLYSDTVDGHYWIDRHPEIEGLSVSAGGSGHAMKMGPIRGKLPRTCSNVEKINIWKDLNGEHLKMFLKQKNKQDIPKDELILKINKIYFSQTQVQSI